MPKRKYYDYRMIKIGDLLREKRLAISKESRESFIEERSKTMFGDDDWISLRYQVSFIIWDFKSRLFFSKVMGGVTLIFHSLQFVILPPMLSTLFVKRSIFFSSVISVCSSSLNIAIRIFL